MLVCSTDFRPMSIGTFAPKDKEVVAVVVGPFAEGDVDECLAGENLLV